MKDLAAVMKSSRFRWALYIAFAVTLVFPIAARRKYTWDGPAGVEFAWVWDALDMLGSLDGIMLACFLIVPGIFGLVLMAVERKASVRTRNSTMTLCGTVPLAAIALMMLFSKRSPFQTKQMLPQLAGFVAFGLMMAGCLVARWAPKWRRGYAMCGIGGLMGVVIAFIPFVPSIADKGRTNTTQIANMMKALDVEGGWFALIIGVATLAASVFAALLLIDRRPPGAWRTQAILWLCVVSLLGALLLPLFLSLPEGSAVPLIVMLVGWILLRMYACIGLIVVGVAGNHYAEYEYRRERAAKAKAAREGEA